MVLLPTPGISTVPEALSVVSPVSLSNTSRNTSTPLRNLLTSQTPSHIQKPVQSSLRRVPQSLRSPSHPPIRPPRYRTEISSLVRLELSAESLGQTRVLWLLIYHFFQDRVEEGVWLGSCGRGRVLDGIGVSRSHDGEVVGVEREGLWWWLLLVMILGLL
jgi:hypothetical protein